MKFPKFVESKDNSDFQFNLVWGGFGLIAILASILFVVVGGWSSFFLLSLLGNGAVTVICFHDARKILKNKERVDVSV